MDGRIHQTENLQKKKKKKKKKKQEIQEHYNLNLLRVETSGKSKNSVMRTV
jgi:hypothetical protein